MRTLIAAQRAAHSQRHCKGVLHEQRHAHNKTHNSAHTTTALCCPPRVPPPRLVAVHARARGALVDVVGGGLRHAVRDLARELVVHLQVGVGRARLARQVERQRLRAQAPPRDRRGLDLAARCANAFTPRVCQTSLHFP